MKHVLVIYEGAADAPCDELEGATPLEIAHNIHATNLVKRGTGGLLQWSRDDRTASTENALALLLGINAAEAKNLRRGPVEALGTSVDASRWTYAYRGNFITTDGVKISESRVSGITPDETSELTKSIAALFPGEHITLNVIGPGRVSVMFDRLTGKVDPGEFPAIGLPIELDAKGNDRIEFMKASETLLGKHAINDVRLDLGENPASVLWLWGGGAPMHVGRPFIGAPLKAAMVSNSPLARGMAKLCGMHFIDCGDLWTESQKPAMIERDTLATCIARHDLMVVYIEAPLEGGDFGPPIEKVKGIDRVDIHFLARVADAVAAVPDTRLMVTALPPDGMALAQTPVLLTGSRVKPDATERWNEMACASGSLGIMPAHRCLSMLVGE